MNERDQARLKQALEELADGDRGAFDVVFEGVWPTVRRYCRKALGSEADSDDAAQLTLEKLFGQASRYDRRTPVLSWALAIASWECRTILQRRRRAQTQATGDYLAPEAPASPEANLIETELKEAAHTALAALKPADRTLLMDAFSDNLSAARSSRFRKQKQRALERLRSAWRQLYGG